MALQLGDYEAIVHHLGTNLGELRKIEYEISTYRYSRSSFQEKIERLMTKISAILQNHELPTPKSESGPQYCIELQAILVDAEERLGTYLPNLS